MCKAWVPRLLRSGLKMPRDVQVPRRSLRRARTWCPGDFQSSNWPSSWRNQVLIPGGTVQLGTLVGFSHSLGSWLGFNLFRSAVPLRRVCLELWAWGRAGPQKWGQRRVPVGKGTIQFPGSSCQYFHRVPGLLRVSLASLHT